VATSDFAYTAGILHDIGRIAMAVGSPDLFDQVVLQTVDQPQEMLMAERAFYRIDHCQAGAILAKSWHLPDAFLETIAHHHDDAEETRDDVASTVAVSCLLADTLGFGAVRYRTPLSYENLPDPVRNLRGVPADAEDLASELAREIQLIESA
jgi:HD-like signal output (HDOD) protein